MTKWTKEQRRAIFARGHNLLVGAGAGAGKTAVLTQRIIELINGGEKAEDFLVVTFSNAAAAEMRERIRKRLTEAVDTAGSGKRAHLKEQLESLPSARISTIHSLCKYILKQHFERVGIDPAFRVGDARASGLLMEEALDEAIEELYSSEKGERLAAVIAPSGDNQLKEAMLSIYKYLEHRPDRDGWINDSIAAYAITAEQLTKSREAKEISTAALALVRSASEYFYNAVEALGSLSERAAEILDNDIEICDQLIEELEDGDITALSALNGVEFRRWDQGSRQKGLREAVAPAKQLRDEGRALIAKACSYAAYSEVEERAAELNRMLPAVESLFSEVRLFMDKYLEKKNARAMLDFADLEYYALRALEHEDIAAEYRQRFKHVFVDEYQDVNMVQEAILKSITDGTNLFMVGDVKQSIYNFRNGDPTLFMEKAKMYCQPDGGGEMVRLNKNFRSSANIISCVNHIFSHIMGVSLDGVGYGENEMLICGRGDIENEPVELVLLEPPEGGSDALEELKEAEREALAAADIIFKLIEKGYNFRDIALLHRTPNEGNAAQAIQGILMASGIPAYSYSSRSAQQPVEADVFISLLKVIDNKRNDTPLLSVMYSSIGGFSAEELAEIRTIKSKFYYECAMEYAKSKENALALKLNGFFDKLSKWKTAAKSKGIEEYVWWLLDECGLLKTVEVMPGGRQRVENLQRLAMSAAAFENEGGGLHAFISRLETGSAARDAEVNILSESDDMVRIMSVHKSKGLQFPAVLFMGLGKRMRPVTGGADIILHKDYPVGIRHINPDTRVRKDTIIREAINRRLELESKAEVIRVMYVGMTRAEKKLILIGTCRDAEKAAEKWRRPLRPEAVASASSLLDWIGQAVIRSRAGGDMPGGGVDSPLMVEEADFSIDIRTPPEPPQQEAEQEKQVEADWVFDMLEWKYPHGGGIPAKLSVSALSQKKYTIGVGEVKTHEAAKIGTAMHEAIRHMRLGDTSKAGIAAQVCSMVEAGKLTDEQAALLDMEKLAEFFESGIARRMAAAKELRREEPFVYAVPAKEIGYEGDDNILLQGIIDCLFLEGDGWVLVDYKTDRLPQGELDIAKERHGRQIELYAKAVERLSGIRVKEKYIYLLSHGQKISV
ncbi:MAG: helicase-exonuclease AddAB subunit AddA [Christensenellales bacterium]|jgi:ATP-dependent helicase/nuclease subunit A